MVYQVELTQLGLHDCASAKRPKPSLTAPLVQRHETLRTTFATLDGEPVPKSPATSVNLPVFDLKGLRSERRQRFAHIRLN